MADPGKTQWWHASTPYERQCVHCGAAFVTRLHGKKTCTPACCHLHKLDYGRQWRADHPIPKKGRRRVLPAVLGHAPISDHHGTLIRFDLVSADLHAWFHDACQKHNCSMSELVRAAIRYAITGKVTIAPRPDVKRARFLQVHVPVEDAIALRAESEKHGDRSQGAVLLRLLWKLKAAIGPNFTGQRSGLMLATVAS